MDTKLNEHFWASSGLRLRIKALTVELDAHDPINIHFTLGTTSPPKGTRLTHHSTLKTMAALSEGALLSLAPPNDRACILAPLYYCFGIVLGNLTCMTHSAAMVYL